MPTEEPAQVRGRRRTSSRAHEPSPVDTPLLASLRQSIGDTARAHNAFLELSGRVTRGYADAFALQTDLMQRAAGRPDPEAADGSAPWTQDPVSDGQPKPLFSRQECLEFARGSAARVLGPRFAAVDAYPARVRLPDEPLMLVDRILSIEAEKGRLGPGRIVTEHDVRADAWYLDGGRAPVCISVEAGQADLFLSAYMGIDLAVRGERTYRLLDATVRFHRGLPRPGDTIRYDIRIDKFIRQGKTTMFLFRFQGFIGGDPLITMTDGCAGFFTPEEVARSGGIIPAAPGDAALAGEKPAAYQAPVPLNDESYEDAAVEALRRGRPADCFGDLFAGIELAESLRLPGGRLHLIDRILSLEPQGGAFGLGRVRAEADIDPAAWFLTCHFVDDMVMPGTLMYECCAQALRVFLQRLGWISVQNGPCYEPVPETPAVLKCRGPVTPATRRVIYDVHIKKIGFRPEPYVVADADMYADGRHIVRFEGMSMQVSGLTREAVESFWLLRRRSPQPVSGFRPFDRRRLEEFAAGSPSRAFGDKYRPFDDESRFIARLPKPPFLMMDRVVSAEPDPWVLKPGGWIESEYDVPPDAWYFRAEGAPAAPLGIVMEIALQPCGWLAAYMGSALRSPKDLCFRNLGGEAVLHREVAPDIGTLTVRARLTQVSEVADMIVEHFDFRVSAGGDPVYAGTSYFGFFTREALASQQGLAKDRTAGAGAVHSHFSAGRVVFADDPPRFPGDTAGPPPLSPGMPSKAIRMIDRIDGVSWGSEPSRAGWIRGSKVVDPDEWFFKAHFHRDPVCPGSLGIESLVQLLKFAALQKWPESKGRHRFALPIGTAHSWTYRGQVLPKNRSVVVDAALNTVTEKPVPGITADGWLQVDGLTIYRMQNFGIQLLPV
jgi:3-hydroxymyristoyl/3-hydroxydecanoyl-(acyl carrier protein) dehydratase